MSEQAVILTGGNGTRMLPHTQFFNKGLYPVSGKFILDFALDTLKKLDVKNLVVILGGQHFGQVVEYIKDGKGLGFDTVSYVYQNEPRGISQAINLARDLITKESFYTILSDNIFEEDIKFFDSHQYAAQIVLNKHKELNRFGVASIKNDKIINFEEKPKILNPTLDQYAITGLYKFDSHFFELFKHTKPSERGEYEIVDIIKAYQAEGSLGYVKTTKLWADCGTHQAAQEISNYFLQ